MKIESEKASGGYAWWREIIGASIALSPTSKCISYPFPDKLWRMIGKGHI